MDKRLRLAHILRNRAAFIRFLVDVPTDKGFDRVRDRLKDCAAQIVPCFLHFGRRDIDTVLITRRDLCVMIRAVGVSDLSEPIPRSVSNRPNVFRDDRRRFGIKRLSFPRRLIGFLRGALLVLPPFVFYVFVVCF